MDLTICDSYLDILWFSVMKCVVENSTNFFFDQFHQLTHLFENRSETGGASELPKTKQSFLY